MMAALESACRGTIGASIGQDSFPLICRKSGADMEVKNTPKSCDLLAVIALLSEEADYLRERTGNFRVRFTKRVFTARDLERGYSLCAAANKLSTGAVEIKIES